MLVLARQAAVAVLAWIGQRLLDRLGPDVPRALDGQADLPRERSGNEDRRRKTT
ncbi:hypothetical protein HUO13_22595 [Saccharopolyspora erythraea]|uniref:hypothetical protein n=1 Tax=Saccharopolyspora erythraea TaxID=1836 RepID=UPI001BA5925D|nr:hypothetical protein [Saccharopolyspora erythraea]QUH03247.1 hypothetical protein HUO13_22595 [Saccharopolyspora erythraea]